MIRFYSVGLCFFESSSSSKCSWSYCVVIPNRKARAATKSRKAADTPTTTTRASRRKVVVNGSYERPGRTNINAMQWFKTTFLLQCSSLPRPTSITRHPPPPPCRPRLPRAAAGTTAAPAGARTPNMCCCAFWPYSDAGGIILSGSPAKAAWLLVIQLLSGGNTFRIYHAQLKNGILLSISLVGVLIFCRNCIAEIDKEKVLKGQYFIEFMSI